ncbi:2-hydroxyacid dehydrogenase [Roseomonas elaeocarpi]|uniref:2-hydroxyacid dehydrogenase n=1 Tax=Roseomonas elaeocarpi TaxID=907779 RepID=A0ABV6JPH9_9PROT
MTVLLCGDMDAAEYAEWGRHLRAYLPARETLVLATEDFDPAAVEVAFAANPPPGTLARLPRLRFIQSLWAGVDRLLRDPDLPRDIPVARLVNPAMTEAMVESAAAAVLFLHRQYPAYAAQAARGEWHQRVQPLARERRVGVLGLGELGGATARALAGLGFAVRGWSRRPKQVEGVACLHGAAGLGRMLDGTEILVNLLPLTAETAGILGRDTFARLARGGGVVNLARGGHLDEAALWEALDSGQVGHAVLDVFATEPLPPEHPFWRHPAVTVFPHVAAYSHPETAAAIACRNLTRFRAGERPEALLDLGRGY